MNTNFNTNKPVNPEQNQPNKQDDKVKSEEQFDFKKNEPSTGPAGKKGDKTTKGAPQISSTMLSVLSALGLSSSGSKESDYSAVMSKIETLKAITTDESKKQYYDNLKQTYLNAYSNMK
jgi:hypothetical protein